MGGRVSRDNYVDVPEVRRFITHSALVDALQWTHPDQGEHIAQWCGGTYDPDAQGAPGPSGEHWGNLTIQTREGDLAVSPYDYVIRPARGDCRPYSPEMFAATHSAPPRG